MGNWPQGRKCPPPPGLQAKGGLEGPWKLCLGSGSGPIRGPVDTAWAPAPPAHSHRLKRTLCPLTRSLPQPASWRFPAQLRAVLITAAAAPPAPPPALRAPWVGCLEVLRPALREGWLGLRGPAGPGKLCVCVCAEGPGGASLLPLEVCVQRGIGQALPRGLPWPPAPGAALDSRNQRAAWRGSVASTACSSVYPRRPVLGHHLPGKAPGAGKPRAQVWPGPPVSRGEAGRAGPARGAGSVPGLSLPCVVPRPLIVASRSTRALEGKVTGSGGAGRGLGQVLPPRKPPPPLSEGKREARAQAGTEVSPRLSAATLWVTRLGGGKAARAEQPLPLAPGRQHCWQLRNQRALHPPGAGDALWGVRMRRVPSQGAGRRVLGPGGGRHPGLG